MNENVANKFDPFAILDEARLQRQVNSITGGGSALVALDIDYTGQWDYAYPFEVIAPQALQLGAGSNLISPGGAWLGATGFVYTENGSETSPLTSLTFTNLAGIGQGGSFSPGSMAALTSLDLAALTIVSGSFNPNQMAVLAILNIPALIFVGGEFGPNHLATLTALDMPMLTAVNGDFDPNNMAALETVNVPSLIVVNGDFDPNNMAALTALNAPVLAVVHGFTPNNMAALTEISLPNLTTVATDFLVTNMAALTDINLPSLAVVNGRFLNSANLPSLTTLNVPALVSQGIAGDDFSIGNMAALTTLNLPALTTINYNFDPSGLPALTSVALPEIVYIGNSIDFSDGAETLLTTFTFGTALKFVGGNVLFPSSALNQASVDNILVRLAALDGTGGTTNYTGNTVTITGTSATPSALGIAAAATLTGRGNTVTTN